MSQSSFKIISTYILFLGLSFSVTAQDDQAISAVWGSRLAHHTSADVQAKGSTSFFIAHYFDQIGRKGISDLFGIYGTANLQMGLEHTFGNHFSAYLNTEKLNKTQELGIRYRLTQQTRNDLSPVSMVLSFSVSLDARDKKFFGDNYYFIDRLFYTTQLAVSRQIAPRWQFMSNTSFIHFNVVDDVSYADFLSENISAAWKMTRKQAVFLSCDFPVGIASANNDKLQKPKPLYTLGTIINTRTHNFEIFITNGERINLGKEVLTNHSGFSLQELRFGFIMQMTHHGKESN